MVKVGEEEITFDIDALRDKWYKTSYLLDRKQSFNGKAKERFENYKKQPIEMKFNKDFTGKLAQYGLNPDRWRNGQSSMANGQSPKAADGLLFVSGRLRRERRHDDRPDQWP